MLTSCVFQIRTTLWDLQSLIFTLFSPSLLAGAVILIALKGVCRFLKCLRPFHLTTLDVTAGHRAGNADKLRESIFSTSGPSVFKTASHLHFSKLLWGKKKEARSISVSFYILLSSVKPMPKCILKVPKHFVSKFCAHVSIDKQTVLD